MNVTVTPPPEILYIGSSHIDIYNSQDWEDDPRGLFLMWEQPKKWAKYIMSCDPTVGITGWSRATRRPGDEKTDNAAIEVFQVDAIKVPAMKLAENPETGKMDLVPDFDVVTHKPRYKFQDLQVAEFAAPCDAVEIARICNVIGRIYAGDEDEACELIYEAYPGPGLLTTQELLRIGYPNLWMWQYIDREAEDTRGPGWRSSPTTQRLLWQRARRHLMNEQAIIRSKWLLEEYSNAEIDLEKMRARASYGFHDDRFQAANMAFWAGHKWVYDVERPEEPVQSTPVIDYQRYAPTLDDYRSYAEMRTEALADWE